MTKGLQLKEVQEFAATKLHEARSGAEQIPFHLVERYQAKAYSKQGSIRAEVGIANLPRYSVLKHATGQLAWAVVLAVDLRNSSSRAVKHGPRNTYLTMHTFLPTMEFVLSAFDGHVIGLRGDGLFSGFAITEIVEGKRTVSSKDATNAASHAVKTAKGMIEAVSDAINPILSQASIPSGLQIGVGISVGDIVITRIGLEDANEVTAYGPPVNHACKLSGNAVDEIRVEAPVQRLFPKAKGGTIQFLKGNGYLTVHYPHTVLSGSRPGKPR